MSVNKETVNRLAALSMLELTDAEMQQLSGELETIVDYMNILSQLPCVDADAAAPVPALREDRVIPSRERAELLANAPAHDGETFWVPKTVE